MDSVVDNRSADVMYAATTAAVVGGGAAEADVFVVSSPMFESTLYAEVDDVEMDEVAATAVVAA